MYGFNRMEQLPHLPNIQKFLIFFHVSGKRAKQGKTGRVLAWIWHLEKPEVVHKRKNPWKSRDLIYLWLVWCLEKLRQARADSKLTRTWSFPCSPGSEPSPPISPPAWLKSYCCSGSDKNPSLLSSQVHLQELPRARGGFVWLERRSERVHPEDRYLTLPELSSEITLSVKAPDHSANDEPYGGVLTLPWDKWAEKVSDWKMAHSCDQYPTL